jgi:hypothetical protein
MRRVSLRIPRKLSVTEKRCAMLWRQPAMQTSQGKKGNKQKSWIGRGSADSKQSALISYSLIILQGPSGLALNMAQRCQRKCAKLGKHQDDFFVLFFASLLP